MKLYQILLSNRILRCLLTLWLVGWGHAVYANSLFTVKVPVADQQSSNRQAAFQDGLRTVIKRMVVDPEKLPKNRLNSAINAADTYVDSYRYVNNDDDDRDGLSLLVSYNGTSLNRFLIGQGIDIWSVKRPSTLVWLIQDDGAQRDIEDGSPDSIVAKVLQGQAQERGVPLVFPILDLQDHNQLSNSDVWGLFDDSILKASQRYEDYSILAGRVSSLSHGQVTGRWLYLLNGQRYIKSLKKVSLSDFMAAGVELVADHLSLLLAVSADNTTQAMRLQISGIHKLSDYVALLQYLRNLPQVQRIQVHHVELQGVTLSLYTNSDQEKILTLFKAQNRLLIRRPIIQASPQVVEQPVAVGEQSPLGPHDLYFTWRG